jgi:predicted nuclease with TOPRIM domain
MEDQVKERESEREALLAELKKLESSSPRTKHDPRTKELEERLRDKERHIAGLKKRQNELMNLTEVSSRNEVEINRLKNEIIAMKTQKVDLQKIDQ